jgi:DNA-binding transcriptional MerR regulator
MRMAELSRLSGVSRETIHFYVREGLLPRPAKGGKTVAYYDEAHLERLRVIRRLRDEKYLPLAVIRRMLEAGPARAPDRDIDTLAEVLSIDPTYSHTDAAAGAPDQETTRVALELGLLGAGARANSSLDPTEARVLGAVAEALALEGDARELTLADMRACARELTQLVEAEAGLFFDLLVQTGDAPRSVRALRAGRGAVARFITAYRDLMLRRIVDEILQAISSGPQAFARTEILRLSPERLEQLGVGTRRTRLLERARAGDAAGANDLVWEWFVVGPTRELSKLPRGIEDLLRPRATLLSKAGAAVNGEADPSAIARILQRAGRFPLGEILLAQARLIWLSAHAPDSESYLEAIVVELRRLASAAPEKDADPLASAYAFLLRGQIGLKLPRVLGRELSATGDLERALEVVLAVPGRVEPGARAHLEGNARLALGRWLAAHADLAAARAELERARATDPLGPLGVAAHEALDQLVS